jgi:hypothetical protein
MRHCGSSTSGPWSPSCGTGRCSCANSSRADVVHVFSASYSSFLLAPLPAVLIAKLLGRRVVLNYHSGEAPDHLRRSVLARWVMRRWVDVNVVPSTFLRDVLASFDIPAQVVTNTIDANVFSYRVRNPLRPQLLSTRNFEPIYNVAATIRAFARVQARYPEATMTLVGSGSEEQALRNLVTTLKLRNVTFAGRVAPTEIHRYYAAADIYVQTPRIDNMPLSVLEAFASGLPVVSTRVGGVPAILTNGVHGLLAEDDDEASVAQAVVTLLEAPDAARRLAANGARRARPTTGRRLGTDGCPSIKTPLAHAHGRRRLNRCERMTLHRLRQMTAQEVSFRVKATARIAGQRLTVRTHPPAWNRKDLRHVLPTAFLDEALASAIDAERWSTAHQLLSRTILRRTSLFALDPTLLQATRAEVLTRWPEAASHAADRADAMRLGRYDVLGYRDLSWTTGSGEVDWQFDPVHNRAHRPHSGLMSRISIRRSAITRSSGSSIATSTGCNSGARSG